MAGHKLRERWKVEHMKKFLEMKKILTSEPVLHGLHFDGSTFVVTSDGCQDAFGAVLSQNFTDVLSNGRSVTKLHPLAFALKRTSKSEAKDLQTITTQVRRVEVRTRQTFGCDLGLPSGNGNRFPGTAGRLDER